jgi:hypothetical protein
MFRSYAVWLVPSAISLVGFGAGVAPVAALTTYNFSASYTGIAETSFITPNLTEGETVFESADAPFGLTKAQDRRYALFLDATPGAFIYDSDPNTFGLQGKPDGFLNFFGTGNDKLFGTLSGTGQLNFETGVAQFSGPVTIIGGEGKFSGASGTLFLSGSNSAEDIVPGTVLLSRGGFSVNGSLTTPVPEPSTIPAMVGLAMSGVVVLLRRHLLNKGNLREVASQPREHEDSIVKDCLGA